MSTAISVPSGGRFERSAADISVAGAINDFSFTCWVRIDSLPEQYISLLTFPVGTYFWLGYDSSLSATRGLALYEGNGGHSTTLLPALGTWFHVGLVKVGTSITVYLDGTVVLWDTGGLPAVFTGANSTYTGITTMMLCNEAAAGQDFVGAICAAAFTTTALSQPQVAAIRLASDPQTAGPIDVSSYPLTGSTDLVDTLANEDLVAYGTMGDTTGPTELDPPAPSLAESIGFFALAM